MMERTPDLLKHEYLMLTSRLGEALLDLEYLQKEINSLKEQIDKTKREYSEVILGQNKSDSHVQKDTVASKA